MTKARRSGALVTAGMALAVAFGLSACGESSSTQEPTVSREAGSNDCPARFGCATNPVSFAVRNDSDTAMTLSAKDIFNVREADRPSLTITVPARSTSPAIPVYLGDDGLESRDGYVKGGYRGTWAWEITTDASTTPSRVALGANDDFEFGLDIFEGFAQIGPQVPTWESATNPVMLTSTDGTPTWQAVGSFVESYDEQRPVFTWTFSTPAG